MGVSTTSLGNVQFFFYTNIFLFFLYPKRIYCEVSCSLCLVARLPREESTFSFFINIHKVLIECDYVPPEPPRLNKFNSINVSSYVKFSSVVTILVALHWTFSIFLTLFLNLGMKTEHFFQMWPKKHWGEWKNHTIWSVVSLADAPQDAAGLYCCQAHSGSRAICCLTAIRWETYFLVLFSLLLKKYKPYKLFLS